MPVPEAAVHKNHGFVFWENNVGFSGQLFNIQPVPKPIGKKEFPRQHFRLGVLRFYAAHIVASRLFIVYIGHVCKGSKSWGGAGRAANLQGF